MIEVHMGLSYQDVYLIPRYSPHFSRSEIDVSVQFGHQTFKLPVTPANMKCTINMDTAYRLSENGYFYIMHRFGPGLNPVSAEEAVEYTYQFVHCAQSWKTVSISIGVQDIDKKLLQRIVSEHLRVDFITIDIAHAHSIRMKEMLEFIHNLFNEEDYQGTDQLQYIFHKPFIIAGNVATSEAVTDLENWGADAVKVGIAQGGACTTFGKTGFGRPMFSCMVDCCSVATKPIIADGGIKSNGDYAKALAAGATMVMAGSVFAACVDSPAETIWEYNDKLIRQSILPDFELKQNSNEKLEDYYKRIGAMYPSKKVYFGSASSTNKGNSHHVEGTTVYLNIDKLRYLDKLQEITEDLQSAASYAGEDGLVSVDFGVIGENDIQKQ